MSRWFTAAGVILAAVALCFVAARGNHDGAIRALEREGYSSPTIEAQLFPNCWGKYRVGYLWGGWRGEVYVHGRMCFGGAGQGPAIYEEGRDGPAR